MSTTQALVINGNEFDASSFEYAKPKVNARGGKNVGIRNPHSGKQLYLSTPLMMTWGANAKDYDNNGKFTYDMSLQFPRDIDSNYSDKTSAFLESLKDMEARVKKDAYENR